MPTKPPKPRIPYLARRAHQIIALGAAWPPEHLHDDHSLAQWFGVGPQWPCQTRIDGSGPPFIELGPRRIKYRHDSAMAWLRALPEFTSTAQSPHRGKVWNSPHRKGNGGARAATDPNVVSFTEQARARANVKAGKDAAALITRTNGPIGFVRRKP